MKFTDTHKKWTLTATLATVLSFNLLMSLNGPANGGASNLASESMPAQVASSEEVWDRPLEKKNKAPKADPAKAQQATDARKPTGDDTPDTPVFGEAKIGGKTVKAMFEKDGENTKVSIAGGASGTCYTCGETVNLPTGFTKNVNEMVKALEVAKAMATKSEAKTEAKAETAVALTRKEREEKRRKDQAEEESTDEGKKALYELTKECRDKKVRKKSDDRLECFSDGLVKLLSKEDVEYAKADVFKLFAGDVAKPLMELMKLTPGSERYELGKSIINDLASSIPEDYNYLRQSLAKVNAKIVADAERVVQAKFSEFKQADQIAKANPSNPSLRQQADLIGSAVNQMQGSTEQIANDLGINLYNGFSEAVSNQYISSTLADQYLKVDYAGTVNGIIQGLKQSSVSYLAGSTNASSYQIPMVDIGGGSAFTLSDGSTLIVTGASSNNVSIVPGSNSTTANNMILRPNQLNAQNMVQGSTPMITGTGANSGRIVIVPAGQTGTRTMPAIRP